MDLLDAMRAIAEVAGSVEGIAHTYTEPQAQISEWPSVMPLPGTGVPLPESLDSDEALFTHQLRLWLMVAPESHDLSAFTEIARLVPRIRRAVSRAVREGDPRFDGLLYVDLVLYDSNVRPAVGATTFWGCQMIFECKENTGDEYD